MADTRLRLSPELVLSILYGAPSGQRFTQDTPVLPEVWLEIAGNPSGQVKTLIVPRSGNQAHHVANEVFRRITAYRERSGKTDRNPTNISDMPSVVAADLYLDEIVNIIIPLTRWWRTHDLQCLILQSTERSLASEIVRAFEVLLAAETASDSNEFVPTRSYMPLPEKRQRLQKEADEPTLPKRTKYVRDGTVRLLILLGLLYCASRGKVKKSPDPENENGDERTLLRLQEFSPEDIAKGVTQLFRKTFLVAQQKNSSGAEQDEDQTGESLLIFSVSLNRKAKTSVADSVPTTKADAARRLFHISCERIGWAIIDSGIDASHFAFRRVPFNRRKELLQNPKRYDSIGAVDSRVQKKYDLTLVRRLRNRDIMFDDAHRGVLAAKLERLSGALKLKDIQERLDLLKRDIEENRPIDWDIVEELVTVDFNQTPSSDHGTHVAGTLGGCWPEMDEGGSERWVEGMCPDISLYDFQVIGDSIEDTEFAVMAALRLIRHLNEKNDFTVIHGANLSLSIPHDVTNYACGRTPVCDECRRLVESGVVVVAAAGNEGYNDFLTKNGTKPLHTTTSITDPGNTEDVITVGSTHRREPHSYGISYFSSRGPTGDGRPKPDIIAPGEKIHAPIPNGDFGTLEGTSMAAPHVSGAAAMLMARFPELIGKPRRIKQILCDTATDLGRERFFQGHGLLDILRALQSV